MLFSSEPQKMFSQADVTSEQNLTYNIVVDSAVVLRLEWKSSNQSKRLQLGEGGAAAH